MKHSNELKAGIFLSIAIVIFMASVWILGQERQIFAKHMTLHLKFKDVQGLVVGAPVRLGGISIGHVSNINFIDNLTPPQIKVSILINSGYQKYLSEDSTASIQTQGLLGDKFLAINPGKSKQVLVSNAELTSEMPTDFTQIIDKATTAVNNIADVSENINKILVSLQDSAISDLNATMSNIADATNQIKNGEGSLHNLIYNDNKGSLLQDLEATAANFKAISNEMRNGNGLIHSLVYDKNGKDSVTKIALASESFSKTADQLTLLLKKVETEQGFLHELIYGKSPKFDSLFKSVEASVDNIKKATEALASGSGTLGALLIDSKLYDNLVEVTDDAKRSVILRYAVRSSLEKANEMKRNSENQESKM